MSVSSRLIAVAVLVACPALALAQGTAAPAGSTQAASAPAGPDAGAATPQNITAGSARVLIPDGTSLVDNNGDGTDQWFVAAIDTGKSYVLDVLQSDNDKSANAISAGLFESDGTTAWSGYHGVCGPAALDSLAPSLQGSSDSGSSGDGVRCNIMYYTSVTPPTHLAFIKVTATFSGNFHIRLRENTWYSRYTVNGYNYYVPISNSTAGTVSGWAMYYGAAGSADGTPDFQETFTLTPFAATQLVHSAGSISPATGTLRVLTYDGTDVVVQSLAFNPAINQYLTFTPVRLNNLGNSW